jgi:hypothetical protein
MRDETVKPCVKSSCSKFSIAMQQLCQNLYKDLYTGLTSSPYPRPVHNQNHIVVVIDLKIT